MNEVDKNKINDKEEDFSLIRSFLGGREESFEKLLIKYKNKVFSICYRFTGHYEDADDTAQETFVKVYRALEKFRFESAFSTWMYRITVNTCKNKVTSLKYKIVKTFFQLDKTNEPDKISYHYKNNIHSNNPSKKADLNEKMSILHKQILKLPHEMKILIILRDVEGFSYDEITHITELKLGTVKSKLSRGREILRNKCKDLIEHEL